MILIYLKTTSIDLSSKRNTARSLPKTLARLIGQDPQLKDGLHPQWIAVFLNTDTKKDRRIFMGILEEGSISIVNEKSIEEFSGWLSGQDISLADLITLDRAGVPPLPRPLKEELPLGVASIQPFDPHQEVNRRIAGQNVHIRYVPLKAKRQNAFQATYSVARALEELDKQDIPSQHKIEFRFKASIAPIRTEKNKMTSDELKEWLLGEMKAALFQRREWKDNPGLVIMFMDNGSRSIYHVFSPDPKDSTQLVEKTFTNAVHVAIYRDQYYRGLPQHPPSPRETGRKSESTL